MFFFSVQLVEFLDFCLRLLFFLWRQSPVSRWKMINSKVADCDWFHCPLVQQTIICFVFFPRSFSWFNQVRKIIDFFLHFVLLFGACAQWKHSPLSVVHVTSVFFLLLFHFDSLQRLSAVRLKAMQQWFLPILLFSLLVRVGCGMISCVLHW